MRIMIGLSVVKFTSPYWSNPNKKSEKIQGFYIAVSHDAISILLLIYFSVKLHESLFKTIDQEELFRKRDIQMEIKKSLIINSWTSLISTWTATSEASDLRQKKMSGNWIQISRFFRVPCRANSDQSGSANVKAHLHYVDCQPEEGLLL